MTLRLLLAISMLVLKYEFVKAQDFAEAYTKYAPAVLKIRVKYQGVELGSGSGFFISANGNFVTNRHVIAPAFVPGHVLSITTKDGTELSNLKFYGCSDIGEDLCLLQAPTKPKSWIKPQSTAQAPTEGSRLIAIGHPKGLDWTISDGLLSGKRIWPLSRGKSVEMVQISNPISPGNSGGPLLDVHGNLVGVVTAGMFSTTSQNLNFAISASAANAFVQLASRKSQRSFGVAAKDIIKNDRAFSKELFDRFFKPITDGLRSGSAVKDVKTFTLRPAKSAYKYQFSMIDPKMNIVRCDSETSTDIVMCSIPGFGAVMLREDTPKPDMVKATLTTPLKPVPLDTIAALISNGSLDLNKIPAAQREFLFSRPGSPKCSKVKSPLGSDYQMCTQFVYNAGEPDRSTFYKRIQFSPERPTLEILAISNNSSTSIVPFAISDLAEIKIKQLPK